LSEFSHHRIITDSHNFVFKDSKRLQHLRLVIDRYNLAVVVDRIDPLHILGSDMQKAS
jgi:hypothetical protein